MTTKTAKKTKPIITSLVMVNLHVSYDAGRRVLKDVSEKVATDNDASLKSLSTSIKLIPSNKIKTFTTAISKARDYYKKNSLPWEDGNWRVVPVAQFTQFKDDIEVLISSVKDEFEKTFVTGYDALEKAGNASKGKLKANFPSLAELKGSFDINYGIGQVPSSEDVRIVGIDRSLRSRIKTETEDRYTKQIGKGLKELADGLLLSVSNISERVEGDQKGKKYTRFLENLKEMTNTVEALNITQNEPLNEACKMVRKNIANFSHDAIKSSPMVREAIKGAASGIKDQLGYVTFDDESDGDIKAPGDGDID